MFEKDQNESVIFRITVNGKIILETRDATAAVALVKERTDRGFEASLSRHNAAGLKGGPSAPPGAPATRKPEASHKAPAFMAKPETAVAAAMRQAASRKKTPPPATPPSPEAPPPDPKQASIPVKSQIAVRPERAPPTPPTADPENMTKKEKPPSAPIQLVKRNGKWSIK